MFWEARLSDGTSRRSGDGSGGDFGRGQVRAGGGDQAACVVPCLDAARAAGVDDAEGCGVEAAAFVGSGSEADAPCDHGVAQRALGVIVGRRQLRIVDEGDDGVPIVEDFAGQFADFLLVLVPVALAVPFYARHQPIDGWRLRVRAVVDALDEAAQIANQVVAEAGVRAIITQGERQALADQMGLMPTSALGPLCRPPDYADQRREPGLGGGDRCGRVGIIRTTGLPM